ncbi:MAG: response regulator [Elusimicrobia bacterium]|nr:response regulator [Elusimicrobiota bacterium]
MSLLGGMFQKASQADVLVVDDEASVRAIICDALQAAGLRTAETNDGRKAFAAAKEVRPRLVLLDVDMPVFTGLMALEGLKADAATRDIPVVMVTARALTSEVDEALRRGAAGYVTKPFEVRRLLKKVSEFVPLPNPPPPL